MYVDKWTGLITTGVEEEYYNVSADIMRLEWMRISRMIMI